MKARSPNLLLLSGLLCAFTSAMGQTMTRQEFDRVVDRVENFYKPLVELHHAHPKFVRNWSDLENEAHANRKADDWYIYVAGGLARKLTPDELTYTLCHETGHQLGGYPFNNLKGVEWLSKEGQADYYASFVCLRTLWKSELTGNAKFATIVDPEGKRECDQAWKDQANRFLCYRIISAGQGVINFWNGDKTYPHFSTPEKQKKFSSQCRLDTILQGALCPAKFDLHVIPGYLDPDGINSGHARMEAESSSCRTSANDSIGVRPQCWYP
jgi:hypothetical protein